MGIIADLKHIWGRRKYEMVDDYMRFKSGKKVIITNHDGYRIAIFYKRSLVLIGNNRPDEIINEIDNETLKLIIKIFVDNIEIYDFNLDFFMATFKIPNHYFILNEQKMYIKGKKYYFLNENNEKEEVSELVFLGNILDYLGMREFIFNYDDIPKGYISN